MFAFAACNSNSSSSSGSEEDCGAKGEFEIDDANTLIRYHGTEANLVISDSITRIGSSAFEGCASLKNITIPDSVTSIGYGAFHDCTSLTSISFSGTKAQWNNMSKSSSWNYDIPAITVTCTDGTVTYN